MTASERVLQQEQVAQALQIWTAGLSCLECHAGMKSTINSRRRNCSHFLNINRSRKGAWLLFVFTQYFILLELWNRFVILAKRNYGWQQLCREKLVGWKEDKTANFIQIRVFFTCFDLLDVGTVLYLNQFAVLSICFRELFSLQFGKWVHLHQVMERWA